MTTSPLNKTLEDGTVRRTDGSRQISSKSNVVPSVYRWVGQEEE